MIIVGVSRHGRLRRLFAGTTGDRIASLAGTIDVHLVTHERGRRGRRSRCCALAALPAPPGRPAGWLRCCCRSSLTAACCSRLRGHRPAAARRAALARLTVLVALVGGLLPALLAAVVGFLLLNWFFTPPVGTFTVAEPAQRRGAAGLRGRGRRRRDRRRPGLASRGRGHPRARPRRPPWAPCRARCSPARTPRRRSWTGCARPSGRTRSSLLERGPTGWTGRWPSAGRPVRGHPDERRHPGRGRRRPRDRAVRAGRCAPPTSGCWRRSRCRPAWCSSTARLRERDERAARPGERRGDLAPRCCAPCPTTCARRWRPCGPRSTACSPAALDAADRAELVAAVEPVDRPARAADRQPARPVPAAVGTGRSRCCGRAASTRCCRWPSAGQPPGAVSLEVDETVPLVQHRRRAARDGWWPTWSATPSASPTATRSGCWRTCCRRPSRSWSSTGAPAYRPTSASGCSSRSSGSTTDRPAAWASAWPSRAGWPRRSAARSARRTPPAAG